jgi:hypothetical protein
LLLASSYLKIWPFSGPKDSPIGLLLVSSYLKLHRFRWFVLILFLSTTLALFRAKWSNLRLALVQSQPYVSPISLIIFPVRLILLPWCWMLMVHTRHC